MDKWKALIISYKSSGIRENINYEDYNNLIITSHSTRIEGSTLSIEEAQILIEDKITPKKPIEFSEMTLDHYQAFQFVMDESAKNNPITEELIQEIASKVMKHTGTVVNSALGTTDAAKGDFRKVSVIAGTTQFMDYKKVSGAVEKLVKEINENIQKVKTEEQQLKLSFFAHYELVNIHPFIDGNGRTARLMMNYIQNRFDLPLAIVYAEDKAEYYKALNEVREQDDIQPFYDFMFGQYSKFLSVQLQKAEETKRMEIKKFKP
jgi:Fic family protein